MKKIAQLSLVAAALVAGQAANALSFQTVANTSFTEYFTLTPAITNRLALSVSGLAAQFSALNFEILSGGPVVTGMLTNNSLVGAFNDARNAGYTLTAGTTYTLKITGVTKAAPPGVFGLVSVSSANGTVSPVPEPESYAMLLAGLGLVGTIARRRMKSKEA
jgi:hypothetical protein